ncbi:MULTISPECIES: DUF1998 domain-containing protein [unclassified Rhodococcus (in: high G+C Gram-positive bacteria)]|uniref:DUF1998 domain-containing protein n=1 Tax=unclassified Rhodococcus (in: high G+C Gram-positive bacteria) TaxID=192944 RepID=UPI0009E8CB8E|nr:MULTISPECIES: DUF1998 domain-containing protein [unclassified Rhodococcus (in: high G+C Gram-positive bacteria)]
MSTGNMRRSQLVSPFGVGALSILVNGSSVITAGLDHWFESGDLDNLYPDEFLVPEWRLQERLKVGALRLPPDYRRLRRDTGQRNLNLSVPVLRFPCWCFCIYCKRLHRTKPSMSQLVTCSDESHGEKRKPVMSQVPFIVICEQGHLDDFPFSEWVHRSLSPGCQGTLRLVSQGGGTLGGQLVKCDGCKAQRSLEGITQTSTSRSGEESTVLSDQLASGEQFNCSGSRPWVADTGSGCGFPLRGALRAAGNVYFPKVESSIFLPRHEGGASSEVLEFFRRPDIEPRIHLIHELIGQVTVEILRAKISLELLKHFTDDELAAGLDELFGSEDAKSDTSVEVDTLTSTVTWRYPEYQLLRETPSHPDLTATDPGIPADLAGMVDRVRRVEVLRETRALRGFTRVRDGLLKLSEGKEMLRRKPISSQHEWLPAYVVKGEGLYIELNAQALSAWEGREKVQERAALIGANFSASRHGQAGEVRNLNPRLILLHTMAHLLINELIYTCGYSSAALRERLYVSAEPGREMSGVLIYTAAGDSEGTMGGLVRMARPENLGPIFKASIDKARWCSTDPVCMELGKHGQGPESCNLAACHGCALLPETSCEEFNRFLDRGLVVGTFDDPTVGFFSPRMA